jgi:four helix bundle protein
MGFRDQIQRAVVSIGNNIAEGYERKSNAEFKQYLYIAKGSCGEVRSMAHLASRVGHMSPTASDQLVASWEEIARMLSALIKKL